MSLAAFHAALLARRLAQPEAVDALAAWRWAAALALAGVYAVLRRGSLARLERRQVIALALAALCLHAPALQGPAESDRTAEFWFKFPNVLGPALGLFVLAVAVSRAPSAVEVQGLYVARSGLVRRASAALAPLSPRPPPLPSRQA